MFLASGLEVPDGHSPAHRPTVAHALAFSAIAFAPGIMPTCCYTWATQNALKRALPACSGTSDRPMPIELLKDAVRHIRHAASTFTYDR